VVLESQGTVSNTSNTGGTGSQEFCSGNQGIVGTWFSSAVVLQVVRKGGTGQRGIRGTTGSVINYDNNYDSTFQMLCVLGTVAYSTAEYFL
jgi:hypothetical protein